MRRGWIWSNSPSLHSWIHAALPAGLAASTWPVQLDGIQTVAASSGHPLSTVKLTGKWRTSQQQRADATLAQQGACRELSVCIGELRVRSMFQGDHPWLSCCCASI